ncbi:hypothetical protein KPH14_007744 [Odynerus spinipes]|uniref:Uncharacterized protein n=1 Tax=Odynerus spinipes TaxID=1348599 RepID=A0AAD9VMW1_9HYME|nr:hypothetical protein KPH14_007744 [Odynerus spinipes]
MRYERIDRWQTVAWICERRQHSPGQVRRKVPWWERFPATLPEDPRPDFWFNKEKELYRCIAQQCTATCTRFVTAAALIGSRRTCFQKQWR